MPISLSTCLAKVVCTAPLWSIATSSIPAAPQCTDPAVPGPEALQASSLMQFQAQPVRTATQQAPRKQTPRTATKQSTTKQTPLSRNRLQALQSRTGSKSAPCECEPDSSGWLEPAPRPPRCVFIDLGAADGNTFQHFLGDGYGPVRNCPSEGSYEALLVEANPIFNKPLRRLQKNFSGAVVRSVLSSAAYMCDGESSFYLDTVDELQNYWGSSMSPDARDVRRSGHKQITVPLVNVARLIVESCIPEDYVLVKMDIEGSEHDIVPCLAQSRAAKLIDALYVEKHPEEWSLAGVESGSLDRALGDLGGQGTWIPEYDSPS